MIHRFTRSAAILVITALVVPMLAACGTGTLGGSTPTSVAGITPTPVAGGTPCGTSASFDTNAGAEPTPQPQVIVAETATPATDGTPAQAVDAPAYSEIEAKVKALRDILAGITTPEQYDQKSQEIQKAQKDLADAWNALAGKNVKGWQGWIVATGKDAIAQGAQIWFDTPGSLTGDDNAILVALFDPFTAEQAKPTPSPDSGRPTYAAPEPFVIIRHATISGGKAACLGQKVEFDGIASTATYQDNFVGMILPQGSATIKEDKLSGIQAPAGLQGVAVQFERTMCYGMCPDYVVTAYGNGVVVFNGRYHTGVQGFRIATVDEATVRKLLDALDKSGFDSMKSYLDYVVTDAPSANITVARGGKVHRVEHYQGDNSAPQALTDLEHSIDQILNTAQWVQ